MAKKRLVVDVSAAVRQSIAYALDQTGCEIVRANDGEGAPFALVVTGVDIPNMDGIESTRPIRSAAG